MSKFAYGEVRYIIKGKNIEQEYDMICPNLFYPHNAYEVIYKSDYLKGKEIVNKSVVINNKTFTIFLIIWKFISSPNIN